MTEERFGEIPEALLRVFISNCIPLLPAGDGLLINYEERLQTQQ